MQRFQSISTLLCLTASFCVFQGISATAQIIPDNSLGNESSVVVPNININGLDSDRIDGGAIRGSNLFHSFQEFNIDNGRGAYFSNPENISNILTRVTGDNISNILGTLGVLGNANLFLINPNGIVFGPNARLDVGGSFFASTADSILFENSVEFAASNPDAPPLLTINIPIGLNFRENPGSIVNQSFAVDSEDNIVGLQVLPEKTIALIGGDIQIEGGILTAPQGRIELGSVAGNNTVSLTPIEKGYALNYENALNFQDIALSQEAFVDVRGEGGGDIQIQGRRVTLIDGSIINASTQGSDPGGLLSIHASESVEVIGSGIFATLNSNATGNAGNLVIDTQNLLVQGESFISTATFGNGNGGDLTITATDIELLSDSRLFATVAPGAIGNAGNLTIDTQNLSVRDGAQISTATFGNGDGGNLTITANDIELVGISSSGFPSGLFATVEAEAIGDGGTINLNTQNLRVEDRARIFASTFGNGNAGNLIIDTQHLQVRDEAQIGVGTFGNGNGGNLTVTANDIELIGGNSGLFAPVEAEATGNGGTFTIDTQNLLIRDGAQIFTGTAGNGSGGDITLTATNIELIGTSADAQFPSGLGTSVVSGATSNAGSLTINTQNLRVRDGAQILTETAGDGDGGNLTITAADIELIGTSADGQFVSGLGAAVASGAVGNGGTLTINTQRLRVRDGAQIGTSTSSDGNAGDLIVNATDIELLGTSAFSQGPSVLAATVNPGATGNGGSITIDTQNLLVQDGAKISTSAFGNGDAGNLTINANNIELVGTGSDVESQVQLGAIGNGGTLNIDTQSLRVLDGAQIRTGTFGNGNAGDLTVTATDIELTGTSADGQVASAVDVSVQPEATGNGGVLIIDTQNLRVLDGAQIAAATFGNGDAGDVTITARNIELIDSDLAASVQSGAMGNAGDLTINTQNLQVRDGATISALTFGNGDAGDVTINATDVEVVGTRSGLGTSVAAGAIGNGGILTINTQGLRVQGGAQILAGTSGNGNGGNLIITATDIALVGTSADGQFPSSLGARVNPGAIGNGGTLTVDAQNLLVQDGAQIATTTFGNGDAGDVTITATDIELIGTSADGELTSAIGTSVEAGAIGNGGALTIDTQNLLVQDGAQILAGTFGNGNGGNLIITATDIELIGTSADGQFVSGLAARVEPGAVGNGGTFTIDTQNLLVQNGAQISASTFGNGDSGNLTITAADVKLIGTSADSQISSGLSASVEPGAIGSGGTINLNTQNLVVRNGSQIFTGTGGNGSGGDINLTATNIELSGTTPDGSAPSGLFTSAEPDSTGQAGRLTVNTNQLIVRDEAVVGVRSVGTEAAGDLIINAPNIFLDNQATLNANTTAGEGDIILNTEDLRLRNNSNITTNATGEATGGNITINTETLTAIENSDISANAEDAFGGRVTINAVGVFGTAFRTQQSQFSDITATSELGPEFSGTVELNTELDPSSGLIDLTQTVTDPNDLIAAEFCRQRGSSAFIVTGRGGIAVSPNDKSDGNQINVDLVEPVITPPQNTSQQPSEINDNQAI
ncbi:MAG: filamentous hemagglutinin N-terminal domain-containing protein, partial [Microcoleaceae cyanobacterium]